jgi:hypothetical protein
VCSLKIDKNVSLCLHRIILVLHAPRYKDYTLLAAQWAVQEAAQLTAQDFQLPDPNEPSLLLEYKSHERKGVTAVSQRGAQLAGPPVKRACEQNETKVKN